MTKMERKKRDIQDRLTQLLSVWGAVSKVARAIGVHRTTVATWVSNKRTALPDVAEAGAICEVMGVTLGQLYYGWDQIADGEPIPQDVQDLVLMLIRAKPEVINMVRILLESAEYRDYHEGDAGGNGEDRGVGIIGPT